ncbi:phospholipase a2 [Niveomyces insectorum RCEF 264]|uniref:Phospholipase a2 n=1 Tax=Niveomyces insectorum RCEF 264 TaxID=1081102 RepID=A0A167VFQ3_9HYPO|nr:phospholipase a2 [Niveomyces insectorum RCEF 264]
MKPRYITPTVVHAIPPTRRCPCLWYRGIGAEYGVRTYRVERRPSGRRPTVLETSRQQLRRASDTPDRSQQLKAEAGGKKSGRASSGAWVLVLSGLCAYAFYAFGSHSRHQALGTDNDKPKSQKRRRREAAADRRESNETSTRSPDDSSDNNDDDNDDDDDDGGVWFKDLANIEWSAAADKVAAFLRPDWSALLPDYVQSLQRELAQAPGSLADEIWREAHNPSVHPEVQQAARVRVAAAVTSDTPDGDTSGLCPEEVEFRAHRRHATAAALAQYLGLDPATDQPVHPDDVPVIALCGSAGTGSLQAAAADGLFGCATYTAGVSGSCWLQALYFSSRAQQRFDRVAAHLRARLGVHPAYPPAALALLTAPPTNKLLLAGVVEKMRAAAEHPHQKQQQLAATLGLVDVYGILLAARLLVTQSDSSSSSSSSSSDKTTVDVDADDFKLSHQRQHLDRGQNPMPIYTAVRHEIPARDGEGTRDDTADKSTGKKPDNRGEGVEAGSTTDTKPEPWFQWFEITPYEFFCDDLGAGIPTWALGRTFYGGRDVPLNAAPAGGEDADKKQENDVDAKTANGNTSHTSHTPETTTTTTSTTSNTSYLPELRMPLLLGIFGSAFCATLSAYYKEIRPVVQSVRGISALDEALWGRRHDEWSTVHPITPATLPNPVYGMLPRDLPPPSSPTTTVGTSLVARPTIQLMDAGMANNLPLYPFLRPARGVEVIVVFDASADVRGDDWLRVADEYARKRGVRGWPTGVGWPAEEAAAGAAAKSDKKAGAKRAAAAAWPAPVDPHTSDRLSAPDAGLALVYLPYVANEAAVPGVDPATSDFMSTWNFVYTPDQVDDAMALAAANYRAGAAQIHQ